MDDEEKMAFVEPGDGIMRPRRVDWRANSVFALLDQGLFAASNFLTHVLMARLMPRAEYGAFVVAFTVFLLVGAVFNAFFSEPMLVFGGVKHRKAFQQYLRLLVGQQFRYSAFVGALIAASAGGIAMVGARELSLAILGMAIATPAILFLWLNRRACYVLMETERAAIGGLVYMVLLISGILLMSMGRMPNSLAVFSLIALASALAGVWVVGGTLKKQGDRAVLAVEVAGVRADHLAYGRWAAATNLLVWVPGNIYYLVLPIWGGLNAAGALRAEMNLIMPLMHASVAFSTLLIPILVRTGVAESRKAVLASFVGWFSLASVVYWLVLVVVEAPVVLWLYAGRYGDGGMIWALGGLPVLAGLVAAFGSALRALERPDLVFRSYALGGAAAVIAAPVLVSQLGAWGAVVGMILSQALVAVALWIQYRRLVLDNVLVHR